MTIERSDTIVGLTKGDCIKIEYGAVSDRLMATQASISKLENGAGIALAAIYAWTFSSAPHDQGTIDLLFSVPCFFVLYCLGKYLVLIRKIRFCENYIRILEKEFYHPTKADLKGYEHIYKTKKGDIFSTLLRLTLFGALLILTIVLWFTFRESTILIAAS